MELACFMSSQQTLTDSAGDNQLTQIESALEKFPFYFICAVFFSCSEGQFCFLSSARQSVISDFHPVCRVIEHHLIPPRQITMERCGIPSLPLVAVSDAIDSHVNRCNMSICCTAPCKLSVWGGGGVKPRSIVQPIESSLQPRVCNSDSKHGCLLRVYRSDSSER